MEPLRDQHFPRPYIRILQTLYFDKRTKMKMDKISRNFEIRRGTKQGDPLSSLLFNALLERMMFSVKKSFQLKKLGKELGDTDESRLTNLRFAD